MKVSKVDWKKVYEEGGAHWIEDLQPTQFAQEFAQKLVATKKKSLLEIGCANGRDSILFAIAGLKVTGIDIVPEAVTLSKENAEKVGVEVDFQEGNVEKMEFEDASFDAVYSISVLHSTKMSKSVSEIARVLKPKGLGLIHIYSGTEKIDGSKEVTVTVDEFISLFKDNDFLITSFYNTEDEEFDEVGERHFIIVIEIKKK
jgi:2-polyprenyl-3-methyl-5-hydroxy-6-metoxy-1,4-benzoquinol methylase